MMRRTGDVDDGKNPEPGSAEDEDKFAQRLRNLEGRMGTLNRDVQYLLATIGQLKAARSPGNETESSEDEMDFREGFRE